MPSRPRVIIIAISLTLLTILLSLSKGSTSIPIYQLLFSENNQFSTIFFQLRLPRTLTAFLSGGLLALAGNLMQLLLQNPLADPYVLGISGGAAFFTLLTIFLGGSEYWMIGNAWLGSLFTVALILCLTQHQRWQTQHLLLTGIALASGYSACISLILLLSPDAALHGMLFWLAGDLNDAHYPWIGIAILLPGIVLCWLLAPGLNIFSRGEKEARALGLNTIYYRITLYLLSSLFTASAVTMAGCIGFIGLIIPHITRMLLGNDQRITLPITVMLGGSLLTLADTCARTLLAPQQLPVGLLMTIIGIPIFIWLLQRRPC